MILETLPLNPPPPILLDKITSDSTDTAFHWEGGDATGVFPRMAQQTYLELDWGWDTGPANVYASFDLCDETEAPRAEDRQSPGFFPNVHMEPLFFDTVFSLVGGTQDQADPTLLWRLISEAEDEESFIRAARQVNWAWCSASEFIEAVRFALRVGAHMTARDLALKGIQCHPSNPRLQEMNRLLGPPQVLKTNLPPVSSLKANREWMHTHFAEYQGQWVALREGELVASASTAHQLKARLGNLEGLFIAKVV